MKGKKVLITGGLGFIGSNLAIKCLELGAEVCILDNLMPDTGANYHNIAGFEEKLEIVEGDIRNSVLMNEIVKEKDIIFNLAAQVSHVLSMENPLLDVDINCRGQIILLEACRMNNPSVKIVYTGTRTQTGSVEGGVIKEIMRDNPSDIYGAGKLASEIYHLIYYKAYGLKTTSLRLTNIYGPRAQIKNPKYGVVNWLIGKAIRGEDLTIFEPGTQLRDILHVDDVVDAMILASEKDEANGEVFLLGSGKGISLIEIANDIVKSVGNGKVRLVPWPPERKNIEVGDAVLDCGKIKEKLGWEAKIGFEEGMKRTIEFFEKNLNRYLG